MPDSLTGLNTGPQWPAPEYVPPIPKLPPEMVRRFPELAAYDMAMEKWSKDLNYRLTQGTPLTS